MSCNFNISFATHFYICDKIPDISTIWPSVCLKFVKNLQNQARKFFQKQSFLLQFYLIVLAIFVSDALIGNYSVATNFVVLITFFANPVTTMLLDRKSTRLNSSHSQQSRMPSSA